MEMTDKDSGERNLAYIVSDDENIDGKKEKIYERNSDIDFNETDKNEPKGESKVYKRRWYVLALFCVLTCTETTIWNTWGPIASSCEKAFGWDVSIMALLPNWLPISFVLSSFVFSWIVDVKGIRWACLIAAALIAVGSGVRCITSEPPYVTWTVNIGQFFNGLGGPVAMGIAPVLSVAWFPPHQRTTATATATAFNYLGVAVSYLLGPYMVPESQEGSTLHNQTRENNVTGMLENLTSIDGNDDAELHRIRHDIMILMYIECSWCVFVFLLVLLYFPAKPKLPPSISASVERLDFKSGFRKLIRNKMFWMVGLTYGVSTGVLGMWEGVLDVNLKPHGVSQTEAGWIGFYSIIAGNIGAIAFGKFADVFSKHMRLFLIGLYIVATAAFLWLNLILNGIIDNSLVQIYASIIIGTLCVNASPPLFFEMACENAYPVAEGITNFALTLLFNIAGLIFLAIQMVPNIGTIWENWVLLGSIVVSIPVLLSMHDTYNRLNMDEGSRNDDHGGKQIQQEQEDKKITTSQDDEQITP
ncbi:Disrupted in renal carcinoma protein 2-like [Mizuhopecten yessoensis]|uniref:Disrupted in renal carcinoma protein 2-like n=2 Tax=Mizuhopecten yessoensis TaxID=6573 RepID=A0A210Q4W6_MIZYE|nr:Disrupted in renal carcinoma protein 2-like [Mizuhopecten yessoensis]